MKKKSNQTKQYFIIAFALILAVSCKDAEQNTAILAEIEEYKKKIETYEKEISELDSALIIQKGRKKPGNIIQSGFAKEIYHLYDEREGLINKSVGTTREGKEFQATRSLFYDINDLYDYLSYIKRISEKANVTPSGLRFYFGVYPDNYERDGKSEYAKRQTIFIAPTVEKKEGESLLHLGYTLDNDFNVELLRDKINAKTTQKANFFSFSTSFKEENSTVSNELNGSPPRG